MNCPSCSLELHIQNAYAAVEQGRPVMIQEFACRNPNCPYGRAKAVVKRLAHEMQTDAPPDEGDKLCCGELLAKITAKSYFVAPGVASRAEGGELELTCPNCGSRHTYAIDGLKPV